MEHMWNQSYTKDSAAGHRAVVKSSINKSQESAQGTGSHNFTHHHAWAHLHQQLLLTDGWGFISFLNSSIVRCGNLKLNHGQHAPFDQASYLWQTAQGELLGVNAELMFLTAVMALEMWRERNKEWERDAFLKGPSMARLPCSPLCFPADSGRIAQHAAHRAIGLTSCTATPVGQWTAFSWFVAKQFGDSRTMGYRVGSLQEENDKCSP